MTTFTAQWMTLGLAGPEQFNFLATRLPDEDDRAWNKRAAAEFATAQHAHPMV